MKRNTVQRTLILSAVQSMTNHPTAEEIYEQVVKICPGLSKGTVYRDLNQLASDGEIIRVAVANAPDRFDLTVREHAHGFCTACGKVFDIDLDAFPHVQSTSFQVQRMDVLASGLCKECAERRN